MWIVRWVLILVIIVILLWFSLQNLDQIVTVEFWKYQVRDVPLIMALFVAFIVGAVSWFLVSIVQFVQLKAEIRNIRRENGRLRRELSNLRNLSIEEDQSSQTRENEG